MKYLIQNTDAYKRLCAQCESGKNSHAYLLVFDDPTHTKTALREFAKVILGAIENDYGEYDTYLVAIDLEQDKNIIKSIKSKEEYLIFKR